MLNITLDFDSNYNFLNFIFVMNLKRCSQNLIFTDVTKYDGIKNNNNNKKKIRKIHAPLIKCLIRAFFFSKIEP